MVHVKVALTSNVYRRTAPPSARPQLVVTTTLLAPSPLTIEIRGETDSGTILTEDFRAELFDFYDLTTSKPVTHDLFPGTCDAGVTLEPDNVKEIHSSIPNVARSSLDHICPTSDPVNILQTGHSYRLTLKPQAVRCWAMGIDEMFGDKEYLSNEETPEAMGVLLACEDKLLLNVEA